MLSCASLARTQQVLCLKAYTNTIDLSLVFKRFTGRDLWQTTGAICPIGRRSRFAVLLNDKLRANFLIQIPDFTQS